MNNIRAFREKNGLTQEELGDKLGISQVTISQYESGARTPNLFMAKTIAEFFGISLEALFFDFNISKRNVN